MEHVQILQMVLSKLLFKRSKVITKVNQLGFEDLILVCLLKPGHLFDLDMKELL